MYARVAEALGADATERDAADAIEAVFGLLERRISAGELSDVRHELPRELRALWPSEWLHP
jgi:uncharacterized protein (DUF2267 family)